MTWRVIGMVREKCKSGVVERGSLGSLGREGKVSLREKGSVW